MAGGCVQCPQCRTLLMVPGPNIFLRCGVCSMLMSIGDNGIQQEVKSVIFEDNVNRPSSTESQSPRRTPTPLLGPTAPGPLPLSQPDTSTPHSSAPLLRQPSFQGPPQVPFPVHQSPALPSQAPPTEPPLLSTQTSIGSRKSFKHPAALPLAEPALVAGQGNSQAATGGDRPPASLLSSAASLGPTAVSDPQPVALADRTPGSWDSPSGQEVPAVTQGVDTPLPGRESPVVRRQEGLFRGSQSLEAPEVTKLVSAENQEQSLPGSDEDTRPDLERTPSESNAGVSPALTRLPSAEPQPSPVLQEPLSVEPPTLLKRVLESDPPRPVSSHGSRSPHAVRPLEEALQPGLSPASSPSLQPAVPSSNTPALLRIPSVSLTSQSAQTPSVFQHAPSFHSLGSEPSLERQASPAMSYQGAPGPGVSSPPALTFTCGSCNHAQMLPHLPPGVHHMRCGTCGNINEVQTSAPAPTPQAFVSQPSLPPQYAQQPVTSPGSQGGGYGTPPSPTTQTMKCGACGILMVLPAMDPGVHQFQCGSCRAINSCHVPAPAVAAPLQASGYPTYPQNGGAPAVSLKDRLKKGVKKHMEFQKSGGKAAGHFSRPDQQQWAHQYPQQSQLGYPQTPQQGYQQTLPQGYAPKPQLTHPQTPPQQYAQTPQGGYQQLQAAQAVQVPSHQTHLPPAQQVPHQPAQQVLHHPAQQVPLSPAQQVLPPPAQPVRPLTAQQVYEPPAPQIYQQTPGTGYQPAPQPGYLSQAQPTYHHNPPGVRQQSPEPIPQDTHHLRVPQAVQIPSTGQSSSSGVPSLPPVEPPRGNSPVPQATVYQPVAVPGAQQEPGLTPPGSPLEAYLEAQLKITQSPPSSAGSVRKAESLPHSASNLSDRSSDAQTANSLGHRPSAEASSDAASVPDVSRHVGYGNHSNAAPELARSVSTTSSEQTYARASSGHGDSSSQSAPASQIGNPPPSYFVPKLIQQTPQSLSHPNPGLQTPQTVPPQNVAQRPPSFPPPPAAPLAAVYRPPSGMAHFAPPAQVARVPSIPPPAYAQPQNPGLYPHGSDASSLTSYTSANTELSYSAQPQPVVAPAAIWVNGHRLTEELTAAAEVLAGPIERGGFYWYDKVAGFWGEYGKPCQGVLPPGIPEFDFPLPPDAAGGTTGIHVNGRQLAARDLAMLRQRKFPQKERKRYTLDIAGTLKDEETGKLVIELGRLAQSVEDNRVGRGMKKSQFAPAPGPVMAKPKTTPGWSDLKSMFQK